MTEFVRRQRFNIHIPSPDATVEVVKKWYGRYDAYLDVEKQLRPVFSQSPAAELIHHGQKRGFGLSAELIQVRVLTVTEGVVSYQVTCNQLEQDAWFKLNLLYTIEPLQIE